MPNFAYRDGNYVWVMGTKAILNGISPSQKSIKFLKLKIDKNNNLGADGTKSIGNGAF